MQHNWQNGSPFGSVRVTWLPGNAAEEASLENLEAAAKKLRTSGLEFDDSIVDASWNAWIDQQIDITIEKRLEPGDHELVCRQMVTRSSEQWALDLEERIKDQYK